MERIDSHDPVYPTGDHSGIAPGGGMSIRTYLAAHAPAEPQPWFTPTMPPRPVAYYPDDDARHEHPANWRALEAWDAERERQRYAQWPWAWADAVLAAGLPAALTPEPAMMEATR